MTSNTESTAAPIACALDGGNFDDRVEEWVSLAQRALIERRPADDGVLLRYRRQEGVEDGLRRLAGLEASCCPFLVFDISARGDAVSVSITGPREAQEILGLFLKLPTMSQ